MIIQTSQELAEQKFIHTYIIPIGILLICLFILYRLIIIFRSIYAIKFNKPLWNHWYFRLKKISRIERGILEEKSDFYNNLSKQYKRVFEHRLATFMQSKTFIGREDFIISDEVRVMISTTAVMLTFGFRNYLIDLIDNIIVYPKSFYSKTNDSYHKGETNPMMKAIVFSWEDFEHGYHIGDDNLNLGIHEFGHAIHLNALKSNDVSSLIFNKGFKNLTDYLGNHEKVRKDLIDSKYFRTYAYTNHYEFFAVLLENFIETPSEFNNQFPKLYNYMVQMLNFKFGNNIKI